MIKITVGKLAFSVAAAVAAVTLTPVAASAAPTNCILATSDYPYSTWPGATTRCDGGTGTYRVWVKCGDDYGHFSTHYGSWVSIGNYSDAKCNVSFPFRHSYGRQTQ
ncbi:hypothetical protein KBX06_01940 [Micromonospora sp. C31]|uniref:hypothetical protein n=1 Tax=Micromonospora sp. C31 TaxID=2824876 RepID=UPI001B37D6B8|nr:hypothetical protein [Micromonospora sp. C31]MBQ1071932.1 hypothetical protein [Micromonospora sp. C31]